MAKENNTFFKLKTRRAVVFGFGGVAITVLATVVIYQLCFCEGCRDMGMAALGALVVVQVTQPLIRGLLVAYWPLVKTPMALTGLLELTIPQ